MANINQFVFFDESSTELTSNYIANNGNSSAITLQVENLGEGTLGISVQGMNDLDYPDKYFPIKCVSLEDYKPYSVISKTGLYIIPFDGIQRVRLVSTQPVGTFKVYGIAVG